MALIKCPECGKEISDSAQMCPNCGFSIIGCFNEKKRKELLKKENVEIVQLAQEIRMPKVKPFINGTIIGSIC